MLLSYGSAQQYLVVQHGNKPKMEKFSIGETIGIRIDGERPLYKGAIEGISNEAIYFAGTFIELERIDQIVLKPSAFARSIAASAFVAIPVFLLFTSANNLINTGDRPLVDTNTWNMISVYGGIGLLAWSLQGRKYKLGNKWYLRTVDTSFY